MNLPKDKADEYRAQARRLREKLERLSGRASGLHAEEDAALGQPRQGHGAPLAQRHRCRLLHQRRRRAARCRRPCSTIWPSGCARRSRTSAPTRCSRRPTRVTVSFRGTGLDVDVVPILYDGDPNWYGNLVSQDDGSFLKTNIPLHLEFARKRKARQRDALRAGGSAGEVLGAAHEAGARGLPVQVLHDRDDPGPSVPIDGLDLLRLPGGAAALLHLRRAERPARADRLHRLLHSLRRSAPSPSRCRSSIRSTPATTSPPLYRGSRPTPSSMPRSTPATPSTPRWRRPPSN